MNLSIDLDSTMSPFFSIALYQGDASILRSKVEMVINMKTFDKLRFVNFSNALEPNLVILLFCSLISISFLVSKRERFKT